MKILTVDVGTGTQDILLVDPRLNVENGYKLVLPSPTMMVGRRIRAATRRGEAIVLDGVTMGGGPSHWAAADHARAGLPVYASAAAARTFDDDLDRVAAMGITVVADEEAARLAERATPIRLADFDPEPILDTFVRFGIDLADLSAVAVAVFDHGDAPPGVSDRQFRFEYLDERLRARNSLSAFAYRSADVPPGMTRLRAVASCAGELPCPLVVMDTAPAAILGAIHDPVVAARQRKLVVNVGNFHALAFRLGHAGVEGLFEHHTGELDRRKLEGLVRALADGTLSHRAVFDDNGHGALLYSQVPLDLPADDWQVAVTGPRRALFAHGAAVDSLTPYFASPFGDMMLAGNIGLLAAAADVLPDLAEPVGACLAAATGVAPWDV